MRILIINIYYYPNNVGGTESVIQNLAEGLLRRGHEVAVFSADSNVDSLVMEIIHGVYVYRGSKGRYVLPSANNVNPIYIKIRNNVRNRCNLFVRKEFESVCNDFHPDVIHTHNLIGLSTQIWKYCYMRGIPFIHTIHDYWLLDRRFVKWAGKNSKYLTAVTAPSEFVLSKYENSNLFPNAVYQVVPNGIDIDFDHLKQVIMSKMKRTANEKTKFLYVGQLGKNKGIDILIDSFCAWKDLDAELSICGKGFLEPIIKTAEKIDSRIHYMGQLNRDDLGRIYNDADVLLVPSVWDEPFGMVAIEAYAHGMTVVAGRRGGLIDIVNNTGVGILIDPTNKDELKTALMKYTNRIFIREDICNIPDSIGTYLLEKQIVKFEDIYRQIKNDRTRLD